MKIIHLFSEVIMTEGLELTNISSRYWNVGQLLLETSLSEWNGVLITPVSYLQT